MLNLISFLDIVLPEHCSLCQKSLVFMRSKELLKTPLCFDCIKILKNSLIKRKYTQFCFCEKCGFPLTSENKICMRCREKEWNFSKSESLFFYQDIKKIISDYKFENRVGLSFFFAEMIHNYYIKKADSLCICAVPFRPSAKRKRGWDQIEIITKHLNKKYKLPVNNCLKRANGRPQKMMNYEERLINLNKKISIKNNKKPPRKVLLIDDVFTTGATMDACSKVLKKAGTEYIQCLTLALDL